MIDPEAIAIAILTDAGILAGAEITEQELRPFVQVAASGGPPSRSDAPDHLAAADVTFSIWGRSRVEAADVAGAVRSAVLAAPRTEITYDPPAVVTSTTVTMPSWIPDPDWPVDGRPGPRYVVQGTITAHPRE